MPDRRPRKRPDRVVLTIELPLGAPDPTAVCEHLRAQLDERAPGVVVCDASARRPCDMRTIDLVARLALAARRSGCRLVLREASPQLRSLLSLAGLTGVILCAEDSVLEPER